MMEDKPMTGEEVLQQILGALNGNGMQQASSDVAAGMKNRPLNESVQRASRPW